ncbi:fatty acid desaturase [Hahella ganghwensis]|uniref:fatty acid desaturase n=1 Tax=Hahella ganghwensis TaxID=286420 RepID=UPI003CCB7F35
MFAPHGVNYHCEHHAMPTVPAYHLPRMHKLLKERGFYQQHSSTVVQRVPAVIRHAMSA